MIFESKAFVTSLVYIGVIAMHKSSDKKAASVFDGVLKRLLQTPPDPKVKQSEPKAKPGQKAKKKPA